KQVGKGQSDLVDAMVDQINKSGLLPRPVSTAQDAVAAINALALNNRPPWPAVPAGTTPSLTSSLTPKASSLPPGVYRAGSASEAIGAETPKAWDDVLEMEHEFGGVKKKVFQTVVEEQDK